MKNLSINGGSVNPLRKLSKNQTMMCIVGTDEDGNFLLKTDSSYYKLPIGKITKEQFEEFFIEQEVVDNVFHAVFQMSSENLTLGLPFSNNDVQVDWGDGTINTDLVHNYATAGTYNVKINGSIVGWNSSAEGFDVSTLIEIKNWGTSFTINNNTKFAGCINLKLNDVIGTPIISATDLTGLFSGCSNLTTINNINEWNTTNVTNMSGLFAGCLNFNQPLNFDTTNVTNMGAMLSGCMKLNSALTFDTSNVTDMYGLLGGCMIFNQPLNFDTSSVTNMNLMFTECTNFNQPLTFDTTNVTNMSNSFSGCVNFNQPLNFNTANVTDMGNMFVACANFNQPLNFDTTKVTNMNNMFRNATVFNQDLSNWNVVLIPSKPQGFDENATAWVLPQPVWGTEGN